MPHFDYAAYQAKQAERADAERIEAARGVDDVPAIMAAMEDAWSKGGRPDMMPGPVPSEVVIGGFVEASRALPPPMDAPCLSRQKVQRQVAAAKQAITAQHPAVLERTTAAAAVLVMTHEDLAALLGFPRGEARLAFDLRMDAVSIVVEHPDMPPAEPGVEMHRIPVGRLGD